jgi:hypothetical protein
MDALAQKKITEATQLISEAEKRFFFLNRNIKFIK